MLKIYYTQITYNKISQPYPKSYFLVNRKVIKILCLALIRQKEPNTLFYAYKQLIKYNSMQHIFNCW